MVNVLVCNLNCREWALLYLHLSIFELEKLKKSLFLRGFILSNSTPCYAVSYGMLYFIKNLVLMIGKKQCFYIGKLRLNDRSTT